MVAELQGVLFSSKQGREHAKQPWSHLTQYARQDWSLQRSTVATLVCAQTLTGRGV